MESEGSRARRVDTLIVVVLLAVALLWRVVYFLEMEASPYADNLTLDSQVYHELALAAAEGRWSDGGTFFQAPLYPWVLGSLYRMFGADQTVAKLFQILLSVASCWLVFSIAARVFDRRVGAVALAASAVYGMFLFFANELLAVTLVVFLDLLGLELLLRAFVVPRRVWWWCAGVIFGLSAIARPTILPFLLAATVWVVVVRRKSGGIRAAVLEAALFVFGIALPIAPVAAHNLMVDGDLVLVAANGGVNFYIGNNPASDGITAGIPGTREDRLGGYQDQVRIARENLQNPHATPAEVSGYWYRRGIGHIVDSPGWALRHTAYKALILFNAREISNNRAIEFVTRHAWIFSWASIGFGVVFPFAVAGLIAGRGRTVEVSLLLLFAAVSIATIVPFFISARFRMPLLPIVIIFAAAGVVAWGRWLGTGGWRLDGRRRLVIVVSMISAAAVALLIRPRPELQPTDAQAFFNEAEAYRSHGDYRGAANWYGRALAVYPEFCDAAFNLGRIQAEIFTDPASASAVLKPMVAPCGEDLELRRLLGLTLCAAGRCESGLEHLLFVAERRPGSQAARHDLEWASRLLRGGDPSARESTGQ
jgi:4-amino-4-deoxy-L-arabinose transferase-like glycosyltransferase